MPFIPETNPRPGSPAISLVNLSFHRSSLFALLLLLDLEQQGAVDMRQDTAEGDGGANQRVEFLITANGELQVAWRDALDFKILGCVAGQFKDFGGQVLEDGGDVDSS